MSVNNFEVSNIDHFGVKNTTFSQFFASQFNPTKHKLSYNAITFLVNNNIELNHTQGNFLLNFGRIGSFLGIMIAFWKVFKVFLEQKYVNK